ncbi:hypothetical protein TSUD_334540 [Trifolium subterraneum]|uniref:Uncharacterized protein n=1 Tax=Trifolium subterraneum TaxID=3900 RepID=A0A2Z6LWI3_TRISU|nr:hypothetical protein TSUD_334540 [Trifolium subterraneum]
MFSFFLMVAGRNLPLSPPPPSLDVNFDAPPPVHLNLPPPSPIVNNGHVFPDITDLLGRMATLLTIALCITVVLFTKICWRLIRLIC